MISPTQIAQTRGGDTIPAPTGLSLFVNRRMLGAGIPPSWPVYAATALMGRFFAAF
ncbi:MAG: hypothetical protein SGI88_03260 [Candidatus Hydrogenedentes bacterium]|nr:hypothetical protein [Candidatus Hydrogenedentota bacterium]